MNIEIIRPYVLLLIPVVLVLLLYSLRHMRIKDRFRKIKYSIIRLLVTSFVILALSGLSIKWSSNSATTVFLVDVSDSVKDQQSKIEEFVGEAVQNMPKNNKVGIIAFGKDALVEQFVTDKKLFSQIESAPIQTATNLERAVTASLALFTEDSAKRLVLITDGAQNEGEITNLTSSFLADNIDFKVVQLTQGIGDEVYVSDLTIPDKISIGDNFKVNVTIMSNVATEAKVYLYSGRQLKGQMEVNLQKGVNQYVFKDKQTEGGLKSYKVTVESIKDTNTINNEYSAFTDVKAKPRILLVEGIPNTGEAFEKLLSSAGILYDKTSPNGAPTSISQMNEYKSIILLNAYYDDFKKGFVDNIESYVKDYAGGLIAVGGDNSFALGAYKDTVLEKILPVDMDLKGEKEIPKMAMAMVIDHSGSMLDTGGGNITGLDLAKQAAIKGLESLRSTDEVGVLAFDDRYDWAVKLQLAKNISAIEDSIAGIAAGGGTSIYPAIQEAVNQLKKSDAKLKHIILLTDGQDGYNQYDPVIKELKKEGITLSTVAVGEGADTYTLSDIAKRGNGRYYYTDINNSIPRIFAKEFFLSVKSYLINEEFTPAIVSSHSILDSVVEDGLPSMLGYVASTPKSIATALLESHLGDPILTVWQYGLGKTAAWNSDGTNQWTANYAGWDKYLTLWKHIIDYTITDTDSGEDYLNVTQNATSAKIQYNTKDYNQNTQVTAVYTTESGIQKEVVLNPSTPGQYEGDIALDELGIYSISVRNQQGSTIKKNINTATAMQYSPEYRYDVDDSSLKEFVTLVGGTYIEKPNQIFSKPIEKVKAKFNLLPVFLLLAILLFMLDIATRRLNLHWIENMYYFLFKRTRPILDKIKQEKAAQKVIDQIPNIAAKEVKISHKKPEKEKKNKKKETAKPEVLDTSQLLKKKKERE